jgi:hypothetical protein
MINAVTRHTTNVVIETIFDFDMSAFGSFAVPLSNNGLY